MDNLDLMKARLNWRGGNQEQRMIKDKWRTLQKTFLYSYQACDVQKVGEEEIHRALINPDKNKTDYDDKILSINYDSGFAAGDIFKWVGTNTYWLVYLQELTEDAYFRSEIRRCKYQIKWGDGESIQSTWAYIRGPVETKINFIQKNGISLDVPNWSLNIYMPKNEHTEKEFKRYDRFMFDDKVWEVQVVDGVSQIGILEVVALEYYANELLDDKDRDITDGWKIVPVDEEGTPIEDLVSEIQGDTFIKPLEEVIYRCGEPGSEPGTWSVKEAKRPLILTPENDSSVKLQWTAMLSGQFTLQYTTSSGTIEKIIVVESLF